MFAEIGAGPKTSGRMVVWYTLKTFFLPPLEQTCTGRQDLHTLGTVTIGKGFAEHSAHIFGCIGKGNQQQGGAPSSASYHWFKNRLFSINYINVPLTWIVYLASGVDVCSKMTAIMTVTVRHGGEVFIKVSALQMGILAAAQLS